MKKYLFSKTENKAAQCGFVVFWLRVYAIKPKTHTTPFNTRLTSMFFSINTLKVIQKTKIG